MVNNNKKLSKQLYNKTNHPKSKTDAATDTNYSNTEIGEGIYDIWYSHPKKMQQKFFFFTDLDSIRCLLSHNKCHH